MESKFKFIFGMFVGFILASLFFFFFFKGARAQTRVVTKPAFAVAYQMSDVKYVEYSARGAIDDKEDVKKCEIAYIHDYTKDNAYGNYIYEGSKDEAKGIYDGKSEECAYIEKSSGDYPKGDYEKLSAKGQYKTVDAKVEYKNDGYEYLKDEYLKEDTSKVYVS